MARSQIAADLDRMCRIAGGAMATTVSTVLRTYELPRPRSCPPLIPR